MAVVLTERVKTELMTCEDVVATGRYPYTGKFGLLGENDWAAVREAWSWYTSPNWPNRDFSQISDGQKQRVMLARAVCQQPELLILDEPTSFLDLRYKLEFLTILQQMSRSRHLTVILSLHELDLAGRISDKIACIKGTTSTALAHRRRSMGRDICLPCMTSRWAATIPGRGMWSWSR